jgi:putative hydrolase of the HAD superfamily
VRGAPPRITMLRAVLFDLDDTLFDHSGCARSALDAVRERYDCFACVEPERFERRHGELLEELHFRVLAGEIGIDVARIQRFRRLFESAGVAADDALASAAAAAYRERYLASWQPVAGAIPLMRALRNRVRVGVVSNNLLLEQQEKIRYCGFDRYLDAIVISEDVGVTKPDPAIFEIALRRLGCAAHEAVMVGDSWQTDVAGARAAGIRAIWLNRRGLPPPEPWDVIQVPALEPVGPVLDAIFTAQPDLGQALDLSAHRN